ncbi:MAG: hypothetical protein LUD72_13505, partial [Bacteroidales bacterium]|nr:hypothetical protein [Bacteroidales bacterium]
CKDRTKGWAKIFKVPNLNKKIKDYKEKGKKIKEIIAKLNIPDEVQLYSSLSKVKYTKKGNACYELRFCGQRICGVNVLDSDVENPIIQLSDDDRKRNEKWFGIKDDISGVSLNSAKELFFDKFTSCSIGKVKSWEHKLESLVLREMAKEKEKREGFRDIEPVKLGVGFFQMPTAVKAGTLVPEISRNKDEVIVCGHIDILAKVSCPNGGWMPAVIEVKDENKPVEPIEDVMIQALIYATFLGHLLADKDCGEAWYNIIGGKDQKGECPVPDTIDILVVAMMPPKKYGEPDKINEAPISFEVGDNDKKKTIRLIPCTCYIGTDENFTTINGVELSCFKKNG